MPCQIVLSPSSSSTELTNQDIKFIQDGQQQFGVEKASLAKIGHFDFVSEWRLVQEHVASLPPYPFKNSEQNNSALQGPVENIAGIFHGDVENKWYRVSLQIASAMVKWYPWSWYYPNDLDCQNLVLAFHGGSFVSFATLNEIGQCFSRDHHSLRLDTQEFLIVISR